MPLSFGDGRAHSREGRKSLRGRPGRSPRRLARGRLAFRRGSIPDPGEHL